VTIEPDPVFHFEVSREDRWAVDPWGVMRLVPAGEELPPGWRWLPDKPGRPAA
jgi:hypothetical protein